MERVHARTEIIERNQGKDSALIYGYGVFEVGESGDRSNTANAKGGVDMTPEELRLLLKKGLKPANPTTTNVN